MGRNSPFMNAVLHRIYLLGYVRGSVPHFVRRWLTGTAIHRAWFLGATGHFEENRTRYGLARPYPALPSDDQQ